MGISDPKIIMVVASVIVNTVKPIVREYVINECKPISSLPFSMPFIK